MTEFERIIGGRGRRVNGRGAGVRTQTTDASTFGIVILRAGSPDEARQVMAEGPAVRARVMRAELFPFRVAGVGPALSARA